jgi:hypothetical protein
MNKLQKAAGLLNDEAPKGEFLAYINPKEAGLLSSKGGAGIDINNSGVPSFYGSDDYGSGEDGRGGSSSSSSDNGDSGDNYSHSRFDVGSGYYGEPTTNKTTPSDNDDIDSQYTTGKEFNVTPVNQPSVIDYAKDELRNKTVFGNKTLGTVSTASAFYSNPYTASINALFSGYTAKRDAERKTEPTLATGEDGIGEGDYKSTVGDWAESRGLTDDYSSEDLETQQAIDQQAFDAGFRTEDAKDMNLTGGDSNNPPPTIDSNSAAIPDSIRTVNTAGTGLPDPSGWINSYIGSKANFQDLYNNVRNTLYSSRTQQGLLAVSDSPYYDFLKINKLDRRVL